MFCKIWSSLRRESVAARRSAAKLLRYRHIIPCAQKDVTEFHLVEFGDKLLCPRYRKSPSRAADSTVWMGDEGHSKAGCS